MTKFNNNVPIYLQIADQITKDIISGKYQKGMQIPTVREFAIIFSANPNTCQRAIVELTNQGLLVSASTNGKFVTNDEKIISDIKQKILNQIIDDFIIEINDYGFDKKEALEKLERKCKSCL